MQVRQCVPADVEAVTALYDKVTLHLEQTVNYPRWEYGVYPSASTVETAVDAGVQYLCEDGGAVVGAFILNDDPQGAYGRGEWKTCLQPGKFLVIHTLAVDPDRAGQGIGRFMVRACVEYAAARGLGAIRRTRCRITFRPGGCTKRWASPSPGKRTWSGGSTGSRGSRCTN